MIVLDGTIVGVSLPVIVRDLHLDLSDAQWVNSIYAVVFAALLLSAGRLGDAIGRRRVLVVGVLVFVGGSLFAAQSSSSSSLIWARVVRRRRDPVSANRSGAGALRCWARRWSLS